MITQIIFEGLHRFLEDYTDFLGGLHRFWGGITQIFGGLHRLFIRCFFSSAHLHIRTFAHHSDRRLFTGLATAALMA
jgi:hypothetical protein